jgi:hypothetical protein
MQQPEPNNAASRITVECVEKYAAPFISAMQTEGYSLLHRIDIDYDFAGDK